MFPDIIDHDAEQRLLSFVDHASQDGQQWEVIHFDRKDLKQIGAGDGVLDPLLERLLDGATSVLTTAIVFAFEDGDVVIAWTNERDEDNDASMPSLPELFNLADGTNLGRYYNLATDSEVIRSLCYRKIAGYTEKQISDFKSATQSREGRPRPEILIVEDQPFSSKLLVAMLERTHRVHAAANAEEALDLYRRAAPDIVLLDFELPDVDGDTIAGMITALDPDCYIVMVTANSRRDAVASCRRNGVRGYILKPYSKQKIMQSIEQFSQERDLAS